MAVFTTEHTARKTHRCGSCCKPIKPGQRYKRHAITPGSDLGNDGWWTVTNHADPADCDYLASLQPKKREPRIYLPAY